LSEAERKWVRVLMTALQESVKLQGHYAKLLNMHDGGERIVFTKATEWIARLAATGTIPLDEIHEIFELMSKPPEEEKHHA
jgi:hypothetical protein